MSEAETPNNQPSLPDNAPSPLVNNAPESTPTLTPTELNNLITQIQQQRQHNTELLNRVTQLESQLIHAHKSLQEHEMRSPATEALLNQRQQELNTVQEHNARLLRELELSHQTSQRQQILVETLTEQLETNQQQVAQLERECALLQQRYNEQMTQLAQAEKGCRDLQMRLYRQQRYTLQFKNALEKCLDMSGGQAIEEAPHPRSASPKTDQKAYPLTPKVTAIQPWSVETRLELEKLEGFPEKESPEFSGSLTDAFADELPEGLLDAEISQQAIATNSLEWEFSDTENLAEFEIEKRDSWQSSAPFIDLTPQREMQEEDEDRAIAAEPESPDTSFETPQQGFSHSPEPLLQGSNWPSPVVYPLRPQKKIKSLAAIDLPSFPRRGPA